MLQARISCIASRNLTLTNICCFLACEGLPHFLICTKICLSNKIALQSGWIVDKLDHRFNHLLSAFFFLKVCESMIGGFLLNFLCIHCGTAHVKHC